MGFLPAIFSDALGEVPIGVNETNSYEWKPKVAASFRRSLREAQTTARQQ
jgi:hypothetical protein